MKKYLLTTAACGLVMAAAPASAQVQLELGGYVKGYGVYVQQDETRDNVSTLGDESVTGNEFDIVRDTEVHFGGETTLDNGLTVGAHLEAEADGGDSFAVQESYVYFSGGWGRVNFGAEDGAAYLLQVAAPSADSNIDGIRQYVNPINFNNLTAAGASSPRWLALNGGAIGEVAIDYDQNISGYDDKLTYLSPILNGFQAGLSYTPDVGYASDLEGVGTSPGIDGYNDVYEAALRYEGQFNNIGLILGAGYTYSALDQAGGTQPVGAAGPAAVALDDPTDDRVAYNFGADIDVGPVGFGVVYKNDNAGERVTRVADSNSSALVGDDEETYVFGVDYTTGPFKIGASYLDQDNTFGVDNLDTDKYAAGVVYTYGPGMTFRGSVGYIRQHGGGIGGTTDDGPGSATVNTVSGTYVALGTQINF